MTSMRCVVAAAGRGSRSGLQVPKTLALADGKPIIVRLLATLSPFDPKPLIIVSPEGRPQIEDVVTRFGFPAEFTVQSRPLGMGDAVLQIETVPGIGACEDILLVWGDIPYVQPETLKELVRLHREDNNTLSFATRRVDSCYTFVVRDESGRVRRVVETREEPSAEPLSGERDTGIFIFKREIVLNHLRARRPGAIGRTTGEHGFLYVVSELVASGQLVEGYDMAHELDTLGFNTPEDLNAINTRPPSH